MNNINFDTVYFPPWATVLLITLCSLVIMFIAKRFVLRRLGRLTSKTHLHFDKLLVSSIDLPLTIIILVLNLLLVKHLFSHFELASPNLDNVSSLAEKILIIMAIIIFIDRFSRGIITRYSLRSEVLHNSRSIVKGLTRGLIFGLGILVLLGTLGISITPIIASLGITSLAVALALQPTLENFFSGVQLVFDKPIRVGDFIELESGEQGFVETIGWRSTWIRMLPNNTVIMPNSALSQSKIINYYYPEKELSVPVEVGVHYNSDLEKVERVTLDVAREILKTHKWAVHDYEPILFYHTFDSSSINFTVIIRAQEYFNRFILKSAFIKALHKRYGQEGITIPYPIRAVNLDQEQVVRAVESLRGNSSPSSK